MGEDLGPPGKLAIYDTGRRGWLGDLLGDLGGRLFAAHHPQEVVEVLLLHGLIEGDTDLQMEEKRGWSDKWMVP